MTFLGLLTDFCGPLTSPCIPQHPPDRYGPPNLQFILAMPSLLLLEMLQASSGASDHPLSKPLGTRLTILEWRSRVPGVSRAWLLAGWDQGHFSLQDLTAADTPPLWGLEYLQRSWEQTLETHTLRMTLCMVGLSGGLAGGNRSSGAADSLSSLRSGKFSLINIPSFTM